MAEPAADRRDRWIACSLRHPLRPLTFAAIVRGRDGDPPSLPLAPADLPPGMTLRPSELRILTAPGPGRDVLTATLAWERGSGRSILTPECGGWLPLFWREMEDPPCALYVRGELHRPDMPAVAIVGTRHPSGNGLRLARTLARDLAAEGVWIVSGLALGIDAAAHRGAIDLDRPTIAVLGGGVDRPSPPSHKELAARVAQRGALVSEFPPGTEPRPLHFPRRNRILAALAMVVVVVEGGGRSGARSTVDHALSLGREVAAVPRDPIHEGSVLPNALLRAGANPVVRAGDLLSIPALATALERTRARGGMRPDQAIVGTASSGDRSIEDELLALLTRGGRSVEQIGRDLRRPDREILALLGGLELRGKVRRLPGMRFEGTGGHRWGP